MDLRILALSERIFAILLRISIILASCFSSDCANFSSGGSFSGIFVERLWRTVKHEEVYLKDYRDVPEARHSLGLYFPFYNDQRIHQSLAYRIRLQSVHFRAR